MTALTIVTGGSSGIGAHLAQQAAADGHDVLVVSRTPGAAGRHLAVDLTDPAGWERVAAGFDEALAGVDRAELYHAAGTLPPIGFAGEVDRVAYARNVVLNAAVPAIVGDAFLRAVARRGISAILVMITSGAARTPYPGWSGYCAGKAAVDQWTRTVGVEQERRGGAKVVAIAPGVVDTPMQAEIRATDRRDFPDVERFIGLHDSGRLGDPEDVARRIRSVAGGLDNGSVVDLRDL